MTKWFISKNGEVTGPISEAEAQAIVQNAPDCYGWNPAFTHWKPVGSISEFAGLVPEMAPPAQIPQSMIDGFAEKKQELFTKLEAMDDVVKFTKTYLYELEQEINIYKRLTNNLTDEVKGNIKPFEQKHDGFHATFDELASALSIAKAEINEVVAEFDKRVAEREAESLASQSVPPSAVSNIADLHDNVAEIKPKSASLDNVAVRPKDAASLDPVAEAPKKAAKAKIDKIEFTEEPQAKEPQVEEEKSSVTGILKSVFKGDAKKSDSQVESNVTQLTTGEDDPQPANEPVQELHDEEEVEADREGRMRRRRRRR
ncbi:DUF4339 domain-containing protein [Shewanella sp. WXL01]|uniref:DUF4339 domain-containing protein n=1 Tax=Shewanella maritima TaxID=2520507 RepID=A0A411PK24_9GAMM|nr:MULTISPECIES: DUF4339 domain-containing protein [Shewanella]NKF50876.1 DUF4339 domain-containing protein [Shewanella sp. WXL01]QBF83848.1 DUF4339 domain-containing protein [Shewanella maritima]